MIEYVIPLTHSIVIAHLMSAAVMNQNRLWELTVGCTVLANIYVSILYFQLFGLSAKDEGKVRNAYI